MKKLARLILLALSCALSPTLSFAADPVATDCSICFEPMNNMNNQKKLITLHVKDTLDAPPRTCHTFHAACIAAWQRRLDQAHVPRACPLCFAPEFREERVLTSQARKKYQQAAARRNKSMINAIMNKDNDAVHTIRGCHGFNPAYTFDWPQTGTGRTHNNSFLILAARQGTPETLRILREAGCSLEHQNSAGETALTVALAAGNNDNAAVLIALGARQPQQQSTLRDCLDYLRRYPLAAPALVAASAMAYLAGESLASGCAKSPGLDQNMPALLHCFALF